MRIILALALQLLLVATAIAAEVPLVWNPSVDEPGGSGLAGYNVYRNGIFIDTAGDNRYTDTAVTDGNIYIYSVSAVDVAGNESAQSVALTYTMPTVPFTALNTYYLAPSGCSDANPGTSGSPWCTPNHSVNCGDVIIARAGNYTGGQFSDLTPGSGSFGAVSNCPSVSGGIDGTGGIWFAILLCEGPDLESCRVDGGSGPAFEIQRSNWSVQGFRATMNTDGDRGCFGSLGQVFGQLWHHVAWINNIASTCDLSGFQSGNVGISNTGLDQQAVIGNVVFNGANSLGPFGVCGSGLSIIPAPENADSGTHVFVSQNFVYKSTNSPGASECLVGGGTWPHSDGNGLIYDSLAMNAYNSKIITKNNVLWLNGNACIQLFPQGNRTSGDAAQHYMSNNTCWSNNQDPAGNCAAEFYAHGIYPRVADGGVLDVTNNIFVSTMVTCGNNAIGGATQIYAGLMAGEDTHTTAMTVPPITISDNYFWSASGTTHPGVDGDPGRNTYVVNNTSNPAECTPPFTPPCFNAPWIFGTNATVDPGLKNPSALPTVAPDCTGFVAAVVCMNVTYNIYTLIKPTVAATSKGYQPPRACAADADYPTWLKGIVYLRVVGGNIVVGNELITKPCDM